jgi:hypothetical protein
MVGFMKQRIVTHRDLEVYQIAFEAAESQSWLEFAVKCGYLDRTTAVDMYRKYNRILGKLVRMINNPTDWALPRR